MEPEQLQNGHLIFFPIERFTSLSCALAGTIYSYKADKTIQPYSKIIKFFEIKNEIFPSFIEFQISQTDESKKIKLFFLTRILAMLILSDFDPKYANIVKVVEKFIKWEDEENEENEDEMKKMKMKKIDPIEILNRICSAKKNDIKSLINLLSIIIEYSDYDIDCISKFASSFTSTFLTTTELSDNIYGLTKYIFIKKKIKDDDEEIYNTNGVSIIKNKENTLFNDIDTGDEARFYFLKKIEEPNEDDEITNEVPYASIKSASFETNFSLLPERDDSNKMQCNHNINQSSYLIAEYEMLLTENNDFFEKIPPFSKFIEKSEEKREYKHFCYFTTMMDDLYNQIQENIKLKFDNNDDCFNQLYSIVYNITTFNYYIAKTTKLICEQDHEMINENSFIHNFLVWENYLILLIESADQVFKNSFADDISNYIYIIINTYTYLYNDLDKLNDNKNDGDDEEKDDDDEDRPKVDEKDIQMKKEIVDKMIKFSLYLILLVAGKISIGQNTKQCALMTIVLIDQTNKGQKEWIEQIFGFNPEQKALNTAKTQVSNSFRSQRHIFDPSQKIGSIMKSFHWKALDLITRKSEEFENIMKTVEDFGLEFQRLSKE